MSTDVIEVMAQQIKVLLKSTFPTKWWHPQAKEFIAGLESAGYRIAGPGECVVPEAPTYAMVQAGTEARWRTPVRNADNVNMIWRAMLEASLRQEPESK